MTSQNSPPLSLEALSESVYGIYPDPCQGGFHLVIYQDLQLKKKKVTMALIQKYKYKKEGKNIYLCT